MKAENNRTQNSKKWNIEDLQFLIVNWEKMTNEELVEKLGLEIVYQLHSTVHRLRKEGFDLPKKIRGGEYRKNIQELKKKFKIK